jgi:hypothetical protein
MISDEETTLTLETTNLYNLYHLAPGQDIRELGPAPYQHAVCGKYIKAKFWLQCRCYSFSKLAMWNLLIYSIGFTIIAKRDLEFIGISFESAKTKIQCVMAGSAGPLRINVVSYFSLELRVHYIVKARL